MIDWIAAGLELAGDWIVGNKQPVGFIIRMAAGVLWAVTAIRFGVWGLLAVVIVAFAVNIRNFIKWTKERRNG